MHGGVLPKGLLLELHFVDIPGKRAQQRAARYVRYEVARAAANFAAIDWGSGSAHRTSLARKIN